MNVCVCEWVCICLCVCVFVCLCVLTSPRSRMKQSPWLKLSQLTGTSVALTMRRPLTWSTRCTSSSSTCRKPEATPPVCHWAQEWINQ